MHLHGLAHTLLLLPARVPGHCLPREGALHLSGLGGPLRLTCKVSAGSALTLRHPHFCSVPALRRALPPAEVGPPSSALKARVCSFRFSQMK